MCLIADHFDKFSTVYDERCARRWGYWRSVVCEVAEKFLACGILKHGVAHVRLRTRALQFMKA